MVKHRFGWSLVGFPTRRASATFRDKGTEVPSLSGDKGTTGQARNLATGWGGSGEPVKIWDGTITIFLSKSGTGRDGTGRDGTGRDNHYFFPMISSFRTSFPVLECVFSFF